jgi:hypothetical protein
MFPKNTQYLFLVLHTVVKSRVRGNPIGAKWELCDFSPQAWRDGLHCWQGVRSLWYESEDQALY